MGVVKREGDWRLEKRGEGVYEVTYQKDVEVRIYTEDAPPDAQMGFDTIKTRQVSSYHDAEEIFEQYAHGEQPMGMGTLQAATGETSTTPATTGDEITLSEVPPAGIAFVMIVAGSFTLYLYSQNPMMIFLPVGALMLVAGIGIIAYGLYLGSAEGWREASTFLMTTEQERQNSE
ncbi:hypothetical protein GRX03_00635 [Halovenus sp. WSH3]|uniref:Uncharacterized protein n=1 Tax=Halovenus carboxidivorans TaxID=2692199 RepID=A0A6B0T1L5_9EURY|nr:hypothetical protein [Halovenus carboxidivorans]MXR50116.1 hypothetical protein [Halovenus carboxidivorans]